NGSGAATPRSISICEDQSVIPPFKKGFKAITAYFKPIGGGAPIMNPTVLPLGRTVLRLQMSSETLKSSFNSFVRNLHLKGLGYLNLPMRVVVDDPAVDVDPCVLEATTCGDSAQSIIGWRDKPGTGNDGISEAFFFTQAPVQPGDALV